MPRRAEDRESDERQQDGIETGDDGHGRDARVTEHLRHVHRRESQARHGVAAPFAEAEMPKPAKNLQSHERAPFAFPS